MKVLASTLLFSLAGLAYGQITPTGFPTTETPTTGFPTTAFPTTAQPCMDSTRKFLVNEKLRNCNWVAVEPALRCKKGKNAVATHCPATCGTCDRCNDAKKPFMTKEKGLHTCEWVATKPFGRCKEVGDQATCRKTCGQCATEGAPKCMDSTQKFYVNEILRSCGWVTGAPDTKCKKGKVASHCPGTCKMCDEGCKDSGATFEVDAFTEEGIANNMRTCKWTTTSPNKRCPMIGEDGGESTCPKSCGFC